MKKSITAESKSFILLFAIAFFGVFASWFMYSDYPNTKPQTQNTKTADSPITQNLNKAKIEPALAIDTSDWQTYTNPDYHFEFKYKPDWQIKSIKQQDEYYVIEIDPGAKYSNIKIYVSKNNFYAMDGLPATTTEIAGKPALNLDGMVLGIKDNNNYFTFDLGVSLSLKPYFSAMLSSLKFF